MSARPAKLLLLADEAPQAPSSKRFFTLSFKAYSLDTRQWTEAYKSLRLWATRQRAKRAAPKLSTSERRKSELLRKIAIAERKARQL